MLFANAWRCFLGNALRCFLGNAQRCFLGQKARAILLSICHKVMENQSIIVLCGGISAERPVSLASGRAVAQALLDAGYRVYTLDPALGDQGLCKGAEIADGPLENTRGFPALYNAFGMLTQSRQFDRELCIIFNALHGTWGEDGHAQALLDVLGFKYVGSCAAASALAMDKEISKLNVEARGVPTATSICLTREQYRQVSSAAISRKLEKKLPPPPFDELIVKPNNQGSAVGVQLVRLSHQAQLHQAVKTALLASDKVLIERYLPGRELTVSILGEQALPIVAICPQGRTYDYSAKYHSTQTRYYCPAPIPKVREVQIKQAALTAHRALGARHYSRVDFKLDAHHNPHFLELNTQPGMTATSLFPKAAKATGMSLAQLCHQLVQLAN